MLSIKMLSTTSVQAASSHRQPWVFPSLPEFPEELVSSITVLPLHAGPPTVAVIPGVIVTAQGALVPPACSPGCHTFVSVHFRWVPLRKVYCSWGPICSSHHLSSLNPCPQAAWQLWVVFVLFIVLADCFDMATVHIQLTKSSWHSYPDYKINF